MELLVDKVFGFLPEKGTIFVGILFLLIMFLFRRIVWWLDDKFKLPHMEETNMKKKQELIQKLDTEKSIEK